MRGHPRPCHTGDARRRVPLRIVLPSTKWLRGHPGCGARRRRIDFTPTAGEYTACPLTLPRAATRCGQLLWKDRFCNGRRRNTAQRLGRKAEMPERMAPTVILKNSPCKAVAIMTAPSTSPITSFNRRFSDIATPMLSPPPHRITSCVPRSFAQDPRRFTARHRRASFATAPDRVQIRAPAFRMTLARRLARQGRISGQNGPPTRTAHDPPRASASSAASSSPSSPFWRPAPGRVDASTRRRNSASAAARPGRR